MVLAGYVVITASMKNSRKQKAVLSTVYRGDKSTAVTALELLLAPVSGRRWSLGYLAVSLHYYHNIYLLYNTTAIQTTYHEKPQAKLCLCLQTRKWSLRWQCWALVLWVSLSEQGFPPRPAPMCASTPYSIQSREEDYNLQWDCGKRVLAQCHWWFPSQLLPAWEGIMNNTQLLCLASNDWALGV